MSDPEDVCRLRVSCSSLRDVCDLETVWISFCQQKYGLTFSVGDAGSGRGASFSPKIFYQKLLHRYGPLLGLWQRRNLKFYGGLMKIYLTQDGNVFKFNHLLPVSDIFGDLQEQEFLTISLDDKLEVVVTNHDEVTCEKPAELRYPDEEDGDRLSVVIPAMTDYISSPAEWRELLDTFRRRDTTVNTESALMKFVSVYHSRNMFCCQRVMTPAWARDHHGQHSLPALSKTRAVQRNVRKPWCRVDSHSRRTRCQGDGRPKCSFQRGHLQSYSRRPHRHSSGPPGLD